MAAANPDVVQEMLDLAESVRQDLGEFMQRGKAQRPTGSIYPSCPVISHEKDWGQVPIDVVEGLEAERTKRHPSWKSKRRVPKRQ